MSNWVFNTVLKGYCNLSDGPGAIRASCFRRARRRGSFIRESLTLKFCDFVDITELVHLSESRESRDRCDFPESLSTVQRVHFLQLDHLGKFDRRDEFAHFTCFDHVLYQFDRLSRRDWFGRIGFDSVDQFDSSSDGVARFLPQYSQSDQLSEFNEVRKSQTRWGL